MLKIKNEFLKNKIMEQFKFKEKLNRDSIIEFCNDNKISFILLYIDENYIKIDTDSGSCFIDELGCPNDCKGDYSKFSDWDYDIDDLENKIKNDLNDFENLNKDIVGLNNVSLDDLDEV